MSVKNCEKLEKNQVVLTVEVEAEAFEAAIEKAYRKVRNQVNIPGFRKGKAPRKMIEKLYGVEVFYDEAINIAMPEAYMNALMSEKLDPVGYPEVELLDVSKDGFSFKATLYVYPEVKLGQYKGLSAPRAEVKVAAADVNARLAEMAERNARVTPVERAVAKGDIANIDFEGFDNGVPFEGGKGDNFDLEIGSGSFVPGFEDQLIGMSAGEEKDIDITFPEDYAAELAGKAVVFHVKVNAVKAKEVPALDDEFAKDVSEFDTLAELKKDIKAKLTADREAAAAQAFEDILMQQVVENMECDVPQPMVDEQAKKLLENLKMQVQAQGIPYEQYLKLTNSTEEDLLAQAQAPALSQLKMDLAMEAIAKAEEITVSEEEVEAEYTRTAEQYGMSVEDIKKYVPVDTVKVQLMTKKTVKVVVDSAEAIKPEAKKKTTKKKAEKAEETAEVAESTEAAE